MIGKTILHYKILEELGRGGMGVVYLAEDTKLERKVAIKFLPPQISDNTDERKRFVIEAKAAAALNHNNIATIHAIEESDDEMFIVMEYIEGQELKNIIANPPSSPLTKRGLERGSLSVDDVLNYTTQIAKGLSAAHKNGIVHRDIKSTNIMVTEDGQIKIMDFGLAKVRGGALVTKVGTTLGTAAYMSPEQARGEEVNQQADIWAFGVILYEMLTGELPFGGDYEQAVIYAILNEKPKSISEIRSDVPKTLLGVLNKSMEKDPGKRYQDISEILKDFDEEKTKASQVIQQSTTEIAVEKKPGGKWKAIFLLTAIVVVMVILISVFSGIFKDSEKPLETERKIIVVLPFENLGSSEDEYFADGVTEEITSRLSSVKLLGVISRNSAMQYAKTDKTIKQIGEELGAHYVLEGSVRWAKGSAGKNRVRITPQLIRVSDDTQIWSDVYDHVIDDIFEVQSSIAQQVVKQLDITLLEPEQKTVEDKPTENLEAYDYYLRGNTYFRRSYREEDFKIALNMYQKAVELDPNFALAWSLISQANLSMYWFHYDHTRERLTTAKSAIDKSLEINPHSPEAHYSLGLYYYWGLLDYENALEELEKAKKLKPNDSQVYLSIGAVYRRQGKMELAAKNMEKAFELNPRSREGAFNTAQSFELMRNYEKSDYYYEKGIELSPDLLGSYVSRALQFVRWDGHTKRAREVLHSAPKQPDSRSHSDVRGTWIYIEMFDGNYDRAIEILSDTSFKAIDIQFFFEPRELFYAKVYGLMGNSQLEQSYYDSFRILMENKSAEQPDDPRFHSSLGIAYAGLGRKEDAIREGKKGVELMPVSKEAWRGTFRVKDMATIYVMVGEYDQAIDQLEYLLSIPSELTVKWLMIEPIWKPLHSQPRFKKLVEKYSKDYK